MLRKCALDRNSITRSAFFSSPRRRPHLVLRIPPDDTEDVLHPYAPDPLPAGQTNLPNVVVLIQIQLHQPVMSLPRRDTGDIHALTRSRRP